MRFILTLLLLTTPVIGWAQDDYDAIVEAAGEKFANEDFEGAIADFKRAYEIKKTPNILYNIGRISEKLGRFEEAVGYYETYVNEPDIPIEARTDALSRVKALREILTMRKRKAEEAEKERLARLKEQEKKKKDADKTPPPVIKPPPQTDHTAAIIFLSTGVASLAAGGVMAYLTDASSQEFAQAKTLEARRQAASNGRIYAISSDALLATGGVLTILGAVFFAISGPEEAPTTLLIAPTVRPDSAGVGMQWSF